jgi:cell division protein FtsZ
MVENTYAFDLPSHHKSIIKVIGVGGGGSNAVNHMYNMGIRDVDFVVCNTDRQALESSPVPNKLQIGVNLTSGLGAGANPEKGRNAAIESKEEIKEMLGDGTKMVFVTAGMGGGTGTGGAPVIAQVAKELDILTVGIVTAPFRFEGKKKTTAAEAGIDSLKENCDTVIVISNDKIKEIYGNLAISEAFAQADNVLTTAAKGIAEIITVPGYVNVDFEDVKTVMLNAGAAVMGSAQTSGEDRARRAAEAALNSPLLNNHQVHGAQKILLSIMSGVEAELQMDELADITDYMQEFAGDDADVIFGHGVEDDLGDEIRVTVIATGFDRIDEMELKTKEEPVEEIAVELPKVDLEIEPRYKEPTYEEHEQEEHTRSVFDLESSRRIEQISLFNEEEEEEDQVPSFVSSDSDDHTMDDEGESFDFEFDFTEDAEEKEEEFSFDFDDDFEVTNESVQDEEEADAALEELEGMAHPPSHRLRLIEERKRREEALAQSKTGNAVSPETFKEKWDVPAYERKKVNLTSTPHSTEHNVSRYNLNDDNKIIGNNKFLHDNVD